MADVRDVRESDPAQRISRLAPARLGHGRLGPDRRCRLLHRRRASRGFVGFTLAAAGGVFERSIDRPWKLSSSGCHASITQVFVPAGYEFGTKDAATTVVLFGDFHAEQWFPALESIATDLGLRLILLTKSGCPSVSVEPYLKAYRRYYHECVEWRERALARIAALRPHLIVIANSNANDRLRSPRATVSGESPWARGLADTLQRLRASGATVVTLHDTPRPGFDVPVCLARAAARARSGGESCAFGAGDAGEPMFRIEVEVAARYGDRVVDLSPVICPGGRCSPIHGDTVTFADGNHLTASYSASLAGALLERL